jgi:dolichol-phosphate mannosyltransferase
VTAGGSDRAPELSLAVAVFDAEEHVADLIERAVAALRGVIGFEVLFVDDASTDQTVVQLRNALDYYPELRVLCHACRAGTSAALRSGIEAARAPWVAVLGGSEQADPQLLRPLLAARAESGSEAQLYTLRHGGPSWPELVGQALGMRPDTESNADPAPAVLERSAFLSLPHFAGMHRLLPTLVRRNGGLALDVSPGPHPAATRMVRHSDGAGPGPWLARLWARQPGRRSPVAELYRY